MSIRQINTQAATAVCVLLFLLPAVVDAQPDTLWYQSFYLGGEPMAVIETLDGGYAIGTANWNGDPERRDTDYLILKTDSVGELEWQDFYALDPDTLHQNERCFAIQQLPDSSYVLAGSGPGGPGSMIVRIEPEGEMIFSRFYPRQQFPDFTDCVVSDDGNLVVTSYGVAAKLDSDNGDVIWRHGYAFQNSGEVRQVANTQDGGYLLTGKISSIGAGGNDMYAVKIDSDGEVEWRNAYGTELGESTFDAVQTADGGYCIAGFSNREDNRSAGMLVRIDAQGEEIWRNLLIDDEDNILISSLYAVTETPDGGFACPSYGGRNVKLTRIDEDGNLIWFTLYEIRYGRVYSILLMEDFGYLLGGFASGIADFLIRTEPDSLSVSAWDLQSAEDSLAFEGVPLDSAAVVELTLANEAEYPVYIHDITSDSAAFSVEFEDVFVIEADEEVSIPVTFTPTDSSNYSGTLTVHTKFRNLMVKLSGTGVFLSAPEEPNVIHEFALYSAYPNPFNSTTSISYSLDRDGFVTLRLYDLAGREVANLVNERQSVGYYQTVLNAQDLSSGIYLVRLASGKQCHTQKIVLIK